VVGSQHIVQTIYKRAAVVGGAVFEDVRQRGDGLHARGQRGVVEIVKNVFGHADLAVV